MKTGREKTPEKLREFGVVMALALTVISAILLWRARVVGFILVLFAAAFLLPALFFPQLLRPVERAWMAFAEKLGAVMTIVILVLSFYLIFTPVALVARLFGKKFLELGFESEKGSYWVPMDAESSKRHFLPY